jgi:L-seryl-tRNA(Ser) seleniumtransferase
MKTETSERSLLEHLGVRPLINARGIYSDLGGSRLAPEIWAALKEMNDHYLSMSDLLDHSGELIANLVGSEAARVTPGAAAGLTLSMAACLAGTDPEAMAQLPGPTGMQLEVVTQRGQRYEYRRLIRHAGGRVVEVGSPEETTLRDIDEALGTNTAAILCPAHQDGKDGTALISDVYELARERDVPLVVDAAYMVYPIDRLRAYVDSSDLACFSAKYFGGPNAGGFVCGRADLIKGVAANDFTGYGPRSGEAFGRPFKLDRIAVGATVLALESWFSIDHEERWRQYEIRAERLRDALNSFGCAGEIELGHVTYEDPPQLVANPIDSVLVRLAEDGPRRAAEVAAELESGHPGIACDVNENALIFCTQTLDPGDEREVARRLCEVLS